MKSNLKKNSGWVVVIYLIFILLFRCGNNNESIVRDFFIGNNEIYYNKSLDSLDILGYFGIDSLSNRIGKLDYWEIKNQKPGFFHLKGFIRFNRDLVYLKYSNVENGKEVFGEDQLLFSFSRNDLSKRWKVCYSEESSVIIGDSIYLKKISYDTSIKEEIFTYEFRPFLYSKMTKRVNNISNISILRVSKKYGIIDCIFTNSIDSIKMQFYPIFSRMDTNYFKRKYI